MLSAIVIAPSGAAMIATARTLASLVPAAINGLVRDVVLCASPSAAIAKLVEHAGCGFAENLPDAIALARQDWLLLISAGFAPTEGFMDEAEDFLLQGTGNAVLRQVPDGLWTRLFPDSAAIAALLIQRRSIAANSVDDFSTLTKKAKPYHTLKARARMVV